MNRMGMVSEPVASVLCFPGEAGSSISRVAKASVALLRSQTDGLVSVEYLQVIG